MAISRSVPVSVAERAPRPPPPLQREAAMRDHRPAAEQNGPRKLESPFRPDDQRGKQLEDAQRRGKELVDYDRAHEDPGLAMREGRGTTTSLSPTELSQLDRVDPQLALEARQFDTYSSVVDESRRTGKPIADICKSRKLTPSEFDNTRTAVLERMSKMEYVREAIPGFDQMTPKDQLIAVEAYAASHEGVRREYMDRMHRISHEAIQLPEDPAEVAKQTAQEKKTELAADRKVTIDRLKARLGKVGEKINDADIERMIASGQSIEEIEIRLFDLTLEQNGIKPADYHAREEQRRMKALEKEFQEAHEKGPHKEGPLNLDDYLRGNESDPRVKEYVALRTRNEGLPQPSISEAQEQTIRDIEDAVFGKQTYIRGALVSAGGVRDEIRQIQDNLTASERVERAAKTPASGDQQKASERVLKQEELRQQMAEALEDSVQEVLWNDYRDLREINDRKAQADALDAAEQGDVRLSDGILALQRNQGHHGVETDATTGKTIIHRKGIGEDVRRIAQDKEEGVRRIELRDLSEGEHPVVALYETDERGIIKMDGGNPPQPIPRYFVDEKGLPYREGVSQKKIPATWETVRYEQLSVEDRKLLDQIHAGQGARLTQEIMSDYFIALKPPFRGILGQRGQMEVLGSRDDLKLSHGQSADLAAYLGADMVKAAYQESRDSGRTLADILNEKGIDTKRGGSFWFLLLLLLGGVSGFKKKEDNAI